MSGSKILHVDDEEQVLRTVARYLTGNGYTVISTTSPFIAPIIQSEKPDLIVMDVLMPLLSGDRIISIIRGQDYSAVPVIFFSGMPASELAAFAAKTHPAAYVCKNQGLPALVEKIKLFAPK